IAEVSPLLITMHKNYRPTGLYSPVFFALVIWVAALTTALAQGMLLPTTTLKVGAYTVNAEIAANEASRSQGLMRRTALPADHGMLFVFQESNAPCFWMKNTPLPLSIAFIGANGRIVNIADMQPHSTDTHCAARPILYALEMP